MIVEDVLPEDYAELLAVWENSVRATHDFITELSEETLTANNFKRFRFIVVHSTFAICYHARSLKFKRVYYENISIDYLQSQFIVGLSTHPCRR